MQNTLMGNKIWIGLLAFGAVIFGLCTIGLVAMSFYQGDWRGAIRGTLYMGGITSVCIYQVRSRIKYGPKGPPPEPEPDFLSFAKAIYNHPPDKDRTEK